MFTFHTGQCLCVPSLVFPFAASTLNFLPQKRFLIPFFLTKSHALATLGEFIYSAVLISLFQHFLAILFFFPLLDVKSCIFFA